MRPPVQSGPERDEPERAANGIGGGFRHGRPFAELTRLGGAPRQDPSPQLFSIHLLSIAPVQRAERGALLPNRRYQSMPG